MKLFVFFAIQFFALALPAWALPNGDCLTGRQRDLLMCRRDCWTNHYNHDVSCDITCNFEFFQQRKTCLSAEQRESGRRQAMRPPPPDPREMLPERKVEPLEINPPAREFEPLPSNPHEEPPNAPPYNGPHEEPLPSPFRRGPHKTAPPRDLQQSYTRSR